MSHQERRIDMYEKIANRLNEIYKYAEDDPLVVTFEEVEDYLRNKVQGDLTDDMVQDIESLLEQYID